MNIKEDSSLSQVHTDSPKKKKTFGKHISKIILPKTVCGQEGANIPETLKFKNIWCT